MYSCIFVDRKMAVSKSIRDIYYDSKMIKQESKYENENGSVVYHDYESNVTVEQEYYEEELNLEWMEVAEINSSDAQFHNQNIVLAANNEKLPVAEKHSLNEPKTLSNTNTTSRIECPKCKKNYKNRNSYRVHSYHCNGNQPPIKRECLKCGRFYSTYSSYRIHSYTCGVEPRFSCDNCNFKAHYKRELSFHMIGKHLTVDRVECLICGRKLKNENSLRRHKKYCKRAPSKCEFCPYWTKWERQLQKHVERVHLNKKMTVLSADCSLCNRKFESQASLRCHLNYCEKQTNLQCDSCAYNAKHRRDLHHHITQNHSTLAECPKCGRLKGEKLLNEHILYRCQKNRQFECDYCHYLSARKTDLLKHILRKHIAKSEWPKGMQKI